LKLVELEIQKLETERLILIPYTIEMCENILLENFDSIFDKGFIKGKSWPDKDVIDTVPRILKNLLKNNYSTGFESWLIIKKNTNEIIGDVGFKGYNFESKNVDLGYGIISEERRNGYAEEASRALIYWALSFDFVNKITASCLIDNLQSIHLLKKLAFVEVKQNENILYWSLKKNL
jgi:ribosomal-protein-alanine N-acetyltransferase